MSENILMCAVGAQGSIGTTIAAGVVLLPSNPEMILSTLITQQRPSKLHGCIGAIEYCGWDLEGNSFDDSFDKNSPFSRETYSAVRNQLNNKMIFPSPIPDLTIHEQVNSIRKDIKFLREKFQNFKLVGINILPAANFSYEDYKDYSLEEIYKLSGKKFQDLAYIIAFLLEGFPFVNFTPNPIELPAIVKLAEEKGCVLCGRDGKTGQTYWKVVIASAFAARSLTVEGWYSTNILGNNDGQTLNQPNFAVNKINQKSQVLNDALGYEVDDHIVRIDYYRPRKDNKEAYDVIDYKGFLGENMSMRVSLLCKDSVLAAPMIIDLAILSLYFQYQNKKSGFIPELSLFFKCPLGGKNLKTFQEQVSALQAIIKSNKGSQEEAIKNYA
ncbi:MAG: inositol-3-phosphate synthase [Alphaproteobacteria bacterium]|nr:inositol-3-phosphate synthase [Alphaproteobacteria bacterium]MBY0501890.1 inositol-3-phosphate synthase [Alphaproteobacteria bacterium]